MSAERKTQLFVNAPYSMVKERIETIVALQIGIEVYFSNNIIDEIPPADVREVSAMLQGHDIPCTVHAPFMDLSPGGFDNKIRAVTRERLKKAAELANMLDARGIVCHPGYDKWRFNGNQQLWLDSSVETWTEVLREAGPDLPLMLENVFEEQPETLLMLFDCFREKNLWFCFDTGHFNLFTTVSLGDWLIPLRGRLREFHLHDNHGRADEHLPIGSGTFPFRELKQFLKGPREIFYTLEPHAVGAAQESVQRARELLS